MAATKPPVPGHAPELVWYVSYGSNLSRERFMCYIEGGTPPGSRLATEGCTDQTPPRDDRVYVLPHRMYFAGDSGLWGGAVSFLDHEEVDLSGPDVAYGRAWLITKEQFEQVVAQECGRRARTASKIDLKAMTEPGLKTDRAAGRYATVRSYGEVDGHVMVTCTTDQSQAEQAKSKRLGPPSPTYLWTIARGLRECSDLSDEQIVAYLSSRPGSDGNLDDSVVSAAVTAKRLADVQYLQRFGVAPDGLSDAEVDLALSAAAAREARDAAAQAAARASARAASALAELDRRHQSLGGRWDGLPSALRSQGSLFDRVPTRGGGVDEIFEPDGGFDRDHFDRDWDRGVIGIDQQREFIDEAAIDFGWDLDVVEALRLPAGLDPDGLVEIVERVNAAHAAFWSGIASDEDLDCLGRFAPDLLDDDDWDDDWDGDDEPLRDRLGLLGSVEPSGSGLQWVSGYKRRNPKTGKVELVGGYERRVPPQNKPHKKVYPGG